MNVAYHVRACDIEHIVVALHHTRSLAVAVATEVFFLQSVLLNHGAHRTVEYYYPVFSDFS